MTSFLILLVSSELSSVAHHNPHIYVFVVYLLMQGLFIDKIHFFKFLFVSDKPWIDQLKVITATRAVVVQTSLNFSIGTRKGEYQQKNGNTLVRTNTKPEQLIKHTKISYYIASLIFCKFLCDAYRNGLNRGTPSTSKSTNRVSLIPFVGNLHFSTLLHRVRYLENLFLSQR